MTLFILATTATGQEFAVAEAVNNLGAMAVVPRKIIITPPAKGLKASYDYRPFLPNYVFLAVDEILWSRILHRSRGYTLIGPRGLLPPPRHRDDILPRTWPAFRAFFDRAELEAQRQIERFEAGQRVVRYSRGDKIRIIGDLLDGQLRDKWATFLRMDQGKAVVQVDGVTMMGKPMTARLDPDQIAAE